MPVESGADSGGFDVLMFLRQPARAAFLFGG
jgi:hypothetical protein